MALRPRSVTVVIAGTTAAAPTTLLAASATLTRYVRSLHPYNNDSASRTWNLEFGAATLTALNSEPFGETIAANSRGNPIYFGGKGRRLDNTAISAFASVTNVVTVDVVYDESDTLDA